MCDITVYIHAERDEIIHKLSWDKRMGQKVEATIKKVFMMELSLEPRNSAMSTTMVDGFTGWHGRGCERSPG
ncbi:MAG: hypothetical protein STSR0009_04220 [Methanoregula sp.]